MAKATTRTTTGAAADKTVREMVRKSKRGEGTLTYTPTNKSKSKSPFSEFPLRKGAPRARKG